VKPNIHATGHFATIVLVALSASGCGVVHEMRPQAEPTCGPDGHGTLVGWAVPDRQADRSELASWCLAVGPPMFEAEPGQVDIARGGDRRIDVVSWNIYGRAGDVPQFLRETVGFDCDRQTGARHFVLLVQEGVRRSRGVPGGVAGTEVAIALDPASQVRPLDIIESAQACGLAYFYVPSMGNGDADHATGREDRGNAILSTMPLSDPLAIELPHEVQRRVAVTATVAPPAGGSIRAVSLHLDTFPGIARALTTGGASRERQTLGLLQAVGLGGPVTDLDLEGVTIVAGGDLNTWSEGQESIEHLLDAFPDSPAPDGKPTRSGFPTDHIFVRTGADSPLLALADSYERIDERYGSDHHPRVLSLTDAR